MIKRLFSAALIVIFLLQLICVNSFATGLSQIDVIELNFDERVVGKSYQSFLNSINAGHPSYRTAVFFNHDNYEFPSSKFTREGSCTIDLGIVANEGYYLNSNVEEITVTINGQNVKSKTYYSAIEVGDEKVPCVYVTYNFIAKEDNRNFFEKLWDSIVSFVVGIKVSVVNFFKTLFKVK